MLFLWLPMPYFFVIYGLLKVMAYIIQMDQNILHLVTNILKPSAYIHFFKDTYV